MPDRVTLPVIPLREIVVFPSSVTPLYIMRARSLQALEASLAVDKRVFLITQKTAGDERPGSKDLYNVGSVADVIQVLRLPDGSAKILVEGDWIGRVHAFTQQKDYLEAEVDPIEAPAPTGPMKDQEALRRTLLALFDQYAQLSEKIPEELALSIKNLSDPQQLANAVANYCNFSTEDKQRALETFEPVEKLRLLTQLLATDNELLKLENNILSQVRSKIGRNQKEYFLNEQLKIIEKELGLNTEEDAELDDLHERITRAKMSKPARDAAYRELNRLSKMAPLSPEATVSRTYIEWLTDLPWAKTTKDQVDLDRAEAILNEDHYGLEKVKERIVEYLAVHKLVKVAQGPVLCLVGPPGVGKTSLARSIARALKRKFVRVSLGGMRDEAEIRGHRRTYIGSMPGKLIQWMKKAGSMNPVFLLDEIDKMSSDFRGDPASALLEALDPEQNKAFNDHYLEVDFDLSNVMFITTANTTTGIPLPLLDRMELIRIPGYTEQEKRSIAVNHLIPRQLKAHGLAKRQLAIETDALELLIRGYTQEAGVRNLERQIAAVIRKSARKVAADPDIKPQKISPETVRTFLGPTRFTDMELHDLQEIGVATGLAWTEVGGELLPIETTLMPGKGGLLLTGKLGEVMQESAKAALSYIRSKARELKVDPDFYKKYDIHIHVPEGAIPKDGPSAGITMIVSLISALSNRPVRRDIAMTGEITLRGRVLRIGGLKEKVIAAHRARISTIFIPKDNEPELEEISPEIRSSIRFVPARAVGDVIAEAFGDAPRPAKDESGGGAVRERGRKDGIKPTTRRAPASTPPTSRSKPRPKPRPNDAA